MRKSLTILLLLCCPFFLRAQISLSQVTERTYGNSGITASAVSIAEDSDGGFFVAMNTGNDPVLMKINAALDTLWTRHYLDPSYHFRTMKMNYAGELVILGNGFFLTLNTLGDSLGFVSQNLYQHLHGFELMDNGHLLAVGDSAGVNPYCCTAVITELDERGHFIQSFTMPVSNGKLNGIKREIQHGFYVFGSDALLSGSSGMIYQLNADASLYSYHNYNTTEISDVSFDYNGDLLLNSVASDQYLVNNVDSSGNLIFQAGTNTCEAGDFSYSVYLGARGYIVFSHDNNPDYNQRKIQIIRYDLSGSELFRSVAGSGMIKQIEAVYQVNNTTFLLAGSSLQDSVTTDKAPYLIKIALNDPLPEPDPLQIGIVVYPSLFTETFAFYSKILVPELVSDLKVFDSRGKLINFTYELQPEKFTVHCPDLKNGIYYYYLVFNGTQYRGKLVRMSN